MCINSESLGEEHLVTGTYHTSVVEIDIVDKKPCSDAVGLEGTTFFKQLHVVLIEEQTRLVLGVGCKVMGTAVPQMLELSVGYGIKTCVCKTCLDTCHQITPEGNLCTIERWLLDNTFCTVCHIAYNHLILLIGSIAEEVTFENSLSSRKMCLNKLVVGILYSL